MVYTHNGAASYIEELSTILFYSVNKQWKHYAKQYNPDTVDCELYISAYMKCLKEVTPQTENTIVMPVSNQIVRVK